MTGFRWNDWNLEAATKHGCTITEIEEAVLREVRMKAKKLTGRDIDAMTPEQKQELVEKFERQTPEQRWAASRAPTAAEKAQAKRWVAKAGRGRPKLGKGTRVVSVTVEIDLLARADAYARKAGLKRAELFTQGLKLVVPGEETLNAKR